MQALIPERHIALGYLVKGDQTSAELIVDCELNLVSLSDIVRNSSNVGKSLKFGQEFCKTTILLPQAQPIENSMLLLARISIQSFEVRNEFIQDGDGTDIAREEAFHCFSWRAFETTKCIADPRVFGWVPVGILVQFDRAGR